MAAETRTPLAPPAWAKTDEIMRLDPFRYRELHKKICADKQRIEAAHSHDEVRNTETDGEWFSDYAENMRRARLRQNQEASIGLRRENTRLVERLCNLMRESEARQKQIASPRPPSSGPAAEGTLNTSVRRRTARKIDKDNEAMLGRLLKVGPTISTRSQLAPRNDKHKEAVARLTRIQRKEVSMFGTPPLPDKQPKKADTSVPWRKPRVPQLRCHSAEPAARSRVASDTPGSASGSRPRQVASTRVASTPRQAPRGNATTVGQQESSTTPSPLAVPPVPVTPEKTPATFAEQEPKAANESMGARRLKESSQCEEPACGQTGSIYTSISNCTSGDFEEFEDDSP